MELAKEWGKNMSDPIKKEHYGVGEIVVLPRPTRKVAVMLGWSTKLGSIRVSAWRHNSQRWTEPQVYREDEIKGLAPEDWPQTKKVRKEFKKNSHTITTPSGKQFTVSKPVQHVVPKEETEKLQALNQRLSNFFFGSVKKR